jgi:hypothetical protein
LTLTWAGGCRTELSSKVSRLEPNLNPINAENFIRFDSRPRRKTFSAISFLHPMIRRNCINSITTSDVDRSITKNASVEKFVFLFFCRLIVSIRRIHLMSSPSTNDGKLFSTSIFLTALTDSSLTYLTENLIGSDKL